MGYLHPHCAEQSPLEYEWSGSKSVTLFATNVPAATVASWYETTFGISNQALDPNVFEYYMPNGIADNSLASVLMADQAADEYAIEDIEAYIGSDQLTTYVQEGYKTVGALFIHDPGQWSG